MGIFLKVFLIFLLVTDAEARPISYSGGHTVMHFNDNLKESIYYHYSPSFKYSIGVEKLNNKIFNKNETNIRLTYLLNRKNTKNSQRNLYFQSAISPSDNDYIYGIHGDWETRRYFVGFDYKKVNNFVNEFDLEYYTNLQEEINDKNTELFDKEPFGPQKISF